MRRWFRDIPCSWSAWDTEGFDLYFEFTLYSTPRHIPATWLTNADQRAKPAEVLGRSSPATTVIRACSPGTSSTSLSGIYGAAGGGAGDGEGRPEAVHATGSAHVTVGAARLDGLPLRAGLGLDYYQAHWYDGMTRERECARCTDYATVSARHKLDGRIVIGEFYAGPDTDALQRFADFYAKGYAGALAWSLFWDHTNDKMQIDLAAGQFAKQHADLGPRTR